ncbi:MAG TPA: HEAT repeat domain-containing protein, partial [Anaerolineae bacterium]|nr:HEAT repeat domain-containing protein [Anaerolineae bacterium]
MRKPHKRIVVWTGILVALALLGALIAFTASANPPAAADVRMQNLVNALREDRLTAARHDAQQQLEEAGEAAVPALLVALRSSNATLRRNAADMLGFIAAPQSIQGLTDALMNDSILDVRRNAAWSLGEINSFVPYAALQHAALFDSSSLVRNSAQDSLARIRSCVALSAGLDEDKLNAFAISPQNSDVVYATSARNLLISKDGGKSWQVLG